MSVPELGLPGLPGQSGQPQLPAATLPGQETDALVAQLAGLLGHLLGRGPSERPRLPGDGPFNAGPGRLTAKLAVEAEVTQVIQTGASGEVPLVALKDTVVRVAPIVLSGLAGDTLSGLRVTGELVVTRGNRVVHRAGPTRVDGVRIGPRAEFDPTLWDQELTVPIGGDRFTAAMQLHRSNGPLNFVVPAYFCRPGRHSLVVSLHVMGGGPATPQTVASWRGDVTFHNVSAPRLVLVPVNWTDSAGSTWSPSDADMLSTVADAAALLPFPYFETIVSAIEESSSLMFGVPAADSDPGGCNPAWYDLDRKLDLLKLLTTLLGIGDLVVGFVPTQALPSSGSYVSGCGIQAIGNFVNDANTLAHELGHRYQCGHVRPVNGAFDANYPNYGLQTGSIGYVGIDTSTSPPALHDPSRTQDVMTYRYPRWTSPYTFTKIFDNRELHQNAPADPRRVRRLVVLVSLRLHRDGRVDLRRLTQLEVAGEVRHEWEGATSPLSVDVRDAHGEVLTTGHLFHRRAQGCCGSGRSGPGHDGGLGCSGCSGRSGCGPVGAGREPWLDIDDVIEWPEGAQSLSFHTGGDALLDVSAGEPPTVELAEPARDEGKVRLRLAVSHPRETPNVVVLFTGDDGETWWPVAVDPDGEVAVDESRLPSRGSCRFRVVATAELATTTVDSDRIELPPATIRAHLQLPSSECAHPGQTRLAVAFDLRGMPGPAPADVHWSSDLDGEIGRGFALLADLTSGTHTVTMSAPDGAGGLLSERGIIVVGG